MRVFLKAFGVEVHARTVELTIHDSAVLGGRGLKTNARAGPYAGSRDREGKG